MTTRPYNIISARILEQSYSNSGYHSRQVVSQPRSEENRMTNRPYRGLHRADNQYPDYYSIDEYPPEQRRSSRMGRHHADYFEYPTDHR